MGHSVCSSQQGRFEGRLAVITGSTDGIGLSVAEKLAKEGARVVISSRRVENVQRAEKALKEQGLSVKGVVCHVGEAGDVQRLMKAAKDFGNGSIDILVSNAAINPEKCSLSRTTVGALDAVWHVNVKAAIRLVQEAIPLLNANSSIVFNSSIGAFHPTISGMDMIGAYNVAKTALLGVVKSFAKELGPRGIRVNCVAPGYVPTKFSNVLRQNTAVLDRVMEQTPLQRPGAVEEIADVIAFLASDAASYVTGETIVAAGGLQSRL